MSTQADVLVHYVGNSEGSNATGALAFHEDDRPDLPVGGAGYVTNDEIQVAVAHGIVLEPIDVAHANKHGIHIHEATKQPELKDQSKEDLEKLAEQEGVDTSGLRSKKDLADAIETKRAEPPSLPAGATVGAGTTGAGGTA